MFASSSYFSCIQVAGCGKVYESLLGSPSLCKNHIQTQELFRVFISLQPIIDCDPGARSQGHKQIDEVLAIVFDYIGCVLRTAPVEAMREVWEENAALGRLRFRFAERMQPFDAVQSLAHAMQEYPAKCVPISSRTPCYGFYIYVCVCKFCIYSIIFYIEYRIIYINKARNTTRNI